MVIPMWRQHEWFNKVILFITHAWKVQAENDTFFPVSTEHKEARRSPPWEILLTICDFRNKSNQSLSIPDFPPIKECPEKTKISKIICLFKTSAEDFRRLIKPSLFNSDFLNYVSNGVVDDRVREIVFKGFREGFRTGYTGGNQIARNLAVNLKPDESKMAIEKMMVEVRKGFCVGPFKECPFPNAWCPSQPIINLIFFRPKHKFTDQGKFRLIAHRSFPIGISFNNLVARHDMCTFDQNYEYFTVKKFIKKLIEFGPNTLLAQFDVKDAYKQCKIHTDDLWQQVYKIGELYFVDLGAMFGSVNAGDTWNLVMDLIVRSMRNWIQHDEIEYYVDNCIIMIPPTEGKENKEKANDILGKAKIFLHKANVPYHKEEEPVLQTVFLGWHWDTKNFVVEITKERLMWMKTEMRTIDISVKSIESVIGIIEFLSSVLNFLKAPVGWLRRVLIERRYLLSFANT